MAKSLRLGDAATTEVEDAASELEGLGQCGFDMLPVEMKEKILCELKFSDRLAARGVCKSFNGIIDRNTKCNFKLNDASLEVFTKMEDGKAIEVLEVADLSKKVGVLTRSRSCIVKCVKHLKILCSRGHVRAGNGNEPGTDICCWFCTQQENDINAERVTRQGTTEDNIVALLRLNSDIETLSVCSKSLENVFKSGRLSKAFRLDSLTTFNLLFGDELEEQLIYDSTSIAPYTNLLKNQFPALRTFHYDNRACQKSIDLLMSVLDFVSRHPTIKDLRLNSERGYEYIFYPASLERWAKMFNNMQERIKLVQPTKIFLRSSGIIPRQMIQLKRFEEEFLASQKSLTQITVTFVDSQMTAMLGFLPACRNTLTTLSVTSGIFRNDICAFDCAFIEDCKNLTSLSLDIDNLEWNWFTTVRAESKIENVHLLPKSITELQIEGYLPEWKINTILHRLPKLRKFVSTGYGRCGRNLELLKSVLKYSNVELFILDNDRCAELEIYSKEITAPGFKYSNTWTGFKYIINRAVFVKESVM